MSPRLLLVAVVCVACDSARVPAGRDSSPPSRPAPLDLGSIVDRAARALVELPDRPGMVGTDDGTYRLAARGGTVELLARGGARAGGRSREASAPLRFATESVRFGDREVGAVETVAVRDNVLAIARGAGVVELVEARRGEVEQSWRLAAAPEGGGVTLFVALSGLDLVAETATGLHFRDAATGLGFRYGPATVVDAAGGTLELPVHAAPGGALLAVPQAWLAAARYPVLIDPGFSAEIEIDVPAGSGPTPGAQGSPAVAAGGGVYLVAWEDRRAGSSDPDIYATRVSPAGAVLDPGGIPVAVRSGDGQNQLHPDVAFDGTNFLVVWDDNRSGDQDVWGARVSPGGALLDPSGIGLIMALCDQAFPALAHDGIRYLLVVQSTCPTSTRVLTTRVLNTGVTESPAGRPLTTGSAFQQQPDVTYNGQNFVVVWQEQRGATGLDLVGARVSTSGVALSADAAGRVISAAPGDETAPALASDGMRALLVWQDNRSGNQDIFGAVLARDLTLVCPASCPIAVTATAFAETAPAVAWAGSYLVAWQTDSLAAGFDVAATHLDADGNLAGAASFPVTTAVHDQVAPALAGSGGEFFVAWGDARLGGTDTDVFGAAVTGEVVTAGGVDVSAALFEQRAPAVASNGSGYLVAWQDLRNGADFDLRAVAVTEAGVPGTPLLVSGGGSYAELAPAVAWGGGQYLVAWQSNRGGTMDIWAARLTPAGTFVGAADAAGILVSADLAVPTAGAAGDQVAPSVAYDSTTDTGSRSFVVVWEDRGGTDRDVVGAGLSGDGVVSPTGGFPVAGGAGDQVRPDVAAGGAAALVAWRDGADGRIRGRLVTAAGTTGAGLTIDDGAASTDRDNPAVAWGGADWLVVWQDVATTNLAGQLVSAAGALDGGPIAVSSAAAVQTSPDVAWDGAGDWYVVWQDGRNGNDDIYLARVAASGTVRDVTGLPASRTAAAERAPAIATLAAGDVTPPVERQERGLLVYESNRTGAALRAWARLVRELALGQPCESAADCKSGHCVDAVCCDGPCGGAAPGDCLACSAAAHSSAADGTCAPVAAATVCRPPVGGCDVAEVCDGIVTACPADLMLGAGAVCRPATGPCDVDEKCPGGTTACPADVLQTDGTSCSDGNPCNGSETCAGGVCKPGTVVSCDDGNPCTHDSCEPSTGACLHDPEPGPGCADAGSEAADPPPELRDGASEARDGRADAAAPDGPAQGPDAADDAAPSEGVVVGDASDDLGPPPNLPPRGCRCDLGRQSAPPAAAVLILVGCLGLGRRRTGRHACRTSALPRALVALGALAVASGCNGSGPSQAAGSDAGGTGGTGGGSPSQCPGRLAPVAPAGATVTVGSGTAASCTERALRDALGSVNTSGGGTIAFDCGGTHTLNVTSSLPVKSAKDRTVIIDGNRNITISGGGITRIFDLANYTNFVVQRLTLSNGFVPAGEPAETNKPQNSGAAIRHPWFGTLKAIDVRFENNHCASRDGEIGGGAIYAGGLTEAVLSGCEFVNNSASNGGGILNRGSTLTVVDCVFRDNCALGTGDGQFGNGGGVYIDGMSYENPGGDLMVCGTVFANNTGMTHGSGMFSYFYPGSKSVIRDCVFDGNRFDNGGEGSGALYHEAAPLTLTGTTFSNHSGGQHAGAIFLGQDSTADITNCTFASNRVTGNGAGIFNGASTMHLTNCTFSGNEADYGPAIFKGTSATVTLRNTIFANNTTANRYSATSCHEAMTDQGGNMQWPATKASGSPDQPCVTGIAFKDPRLLSLADNGGFSQTFALDSGSPAIDFATDCPATDQRGMPRSTPCDTGAFEAQP